MTTSNFILMIWAGSMSMTAWAANDAAVAGPVTGFVFDGQAGHIRPMLGLPGAAYLGAAAVSNVNSASVSPDGSSALAIQAGKLMSYTGLASASPTAIELRGAISADRFAWASGAAAAIYSSKSAQAQIVSNLLETPLAGAAIDLSALSGRVTAMAFDGQQIILAVAGGSGGIYAVTAQSGPQRIASAASPSALALAGSDLYFADQQTGQIWQVQNYARQPVPMLFFGDASIASPVGLQLSTDNRRLYIANAGSRTLTVYDVTARSPLESIALSFTPTKLDRFGSASVFMLNEVGQAESPMCVFTDANAAKPAVYFVPAPTGGTARHPMRYRPN